MRVVHDPGPDRRPLATDVETADSFLEQTVGLMGKTSLPEEYALVFRFDEAAWRAVHMLFVRTGLDVLWLVDDEVVGVKTLRPWVGLGMSKADTIVELPAGAAAAVEPGDTVSVEAE